MNYYNEYDKKTAAWLRELIRAGAIPDGIVDERSIAEVRPEELAGYTQCHFFAGIGGWSLALHLAGWPEDRPVWTGSCPCQPFSVAGKGRGTDDERHLWPVFAELIRVCKPSVVFGEQVASKAGRDWLAGVFADLEKMAYQRAGADLCAAGVGAPHIRQRLYWVAHSNNESLEGRSFGWDSRDERTSGESGVDSRLDDTRCERDERWGNSSDMGCPTGEEQSQARERERSWNADCHSSANLGGLGNAECNGLQSSGRSTANQSYKSSYWSLCGTVQCRDGKTRRIPVEPAFFPLVNGISSARVGILRGAGNAIVPQVAAEFVAAYLEC